MPFEWHPNEPPPSIEPHSKAKSRVLRRSTRKRIVDLLATAIAPAA